MILQLCSMWRKLFFLITVFFLQSLYSQNTEIKNTAGTLLSTPYYFCSSESLDLQVDDYTQSSSSSLVVEPINNYLHIINSSIGESDVPFSVTTRDNVFSLPLNLGFNFNFFGTAYTKLVVGTNGRIVFTNDSVLDNLNDNGTYIDRTFTDALQEKLPSVKYNEVYKNAPTDRQIPLAQIFAGFTRLRSNSGTTLYRYKYFTDGTNSGIAVTFQDAIPHNGFGGDYGGRLTSHVLIFDDGRIVINIENKGSVTYNALLGLQNEDATEWMVPPHGDSAYNYNNDYWPSESTKAFVFKTGITRTPSYSWKRNGNEFSTARTITGFTPNDGDKLTVDITFAEAGVSSKFSEVIFKEIKRPNITKAVNGCSIILSIDAATYDSGLVYKWFRDGIDTGKTGQSLSLDSTATPGNYSVKVFKPDGSPACSFESNKIEIKKFFPNQIKSQYTFCDNSATAPPSTTVNLYNEFYPVYSSSLNTEEYDVEFYEGVTLIADPANYNLVVNNDVEITIKRKLKGSSVYCATDTVKLNYISAKPTESISICSFTTTYDLKNYFEAQFPNAVYSFNYTYSDGSVVSNANAVDVSRNVKVTVTKMGGSCPVTTEINFIPGTSISVPSVPIQQRCSGSDNNANRFDFNEIRKIIDSGNIYTTIKFYRKSDDSEIVVGGYSDNSNLNSAGYFWTSKFGDYIIYARIFDNANPTCYGQSSDIILRVYSKPVLVGANPIPLFNCAGNTIFNLTKTFTYSSIDPSITPVERYFAPDGTQLTGTQISSYDASAYTGMPYIIIEFNPSCFSERINFDLKYNPLPTSAISQIPTCVATTYSLQNFKDSVITNSSQYTFYESDGVTEMTSDFSWTSFPHQVQYFIKNNTTGCLSSLQTVEFIVGTSTPILKTNHPYKVCDTDFDGRTTFSLDSVKNQFTNDTSATFEYFKDAALNQSIPANYTNETAYNQKVYARIKSAGYCPVVVTIDLKANTPTKSSTLQDKYFICFGDTVSIDAGAENIEWEWSDGQNTQVANFTAAGNYSVKLTNSDGCFYTHNFVISDENQPVIEQINQNESQIEVIATGLYPIEYSFDGGRTWQLSNIYPNPTKPEYEIQVRSVLPDGSYCLGEKSFIYTITVSNFISPNDDGRNDTWLIKNLDRMEEVEIIISDRYGKSVFHTTDINNLEWTGKHNGRALSTGTYWYVVKWFDPARKKSEIRQGWILLKNRN